MARLAGTWRVTDTRAMHFSVFGIEVAPALVALGLVGLLCWQLVHLKLAMMSEFWPSAIGTVLEACVEETRDSDGDLEYVLRLKYIYTVRGDQYEGKRLDFRWKTSGSLNHLQNKLAGIAPTLPHRVYYHPKHPWLSVLNPGATWHNYAAIVLVFAIVMIAAHAATRVG